MQMTRSTRVLGNFTSLYAFPRKGEMMTANVQVVYQQQKLIFPLHSDQVSPKVASKRQILYI